MSSSPSVPDKPAEVRGKNSWKGDAPQPDTLTIRVSARDTVTSEQYDRTVPLVTGTTEDGVEWDVPAWRSHLRQVIEDENPQPGDVAAFRCFGEDVATRQILYGLNVERNGSEPSV